MMIIYHPNLNELNRKNKMCGIIGAVGNLGISVRKMVKMMLLLDQVRGFNSTGIACVDSDGVYTYKKAVHSTDFLEYKQTNDLMDDWSNIAIIGHNRAATKGAVNNANAHPFSYGEITGVHNGTLRDQSLLDDHKDFEVDSENVFYHMAKHGAEDTISKLNGAFTLVWWDNENSTVNFVRNKERPLVYCYSEDGKTLLYASEAWMIQVAAMKSNVKIGKIKELKTGNLMSVSLSKPYNKHVTKIDSRVTNKEVKFHVPKLPTQTGRGGYAGKPLEYTVSFELDTMVIVNNIPTYYGDTDCGSHVEVQDWHGVYKPNFNVRYSGKTSVRKWLSGKPCYIIAAREITLVKKLDDLFAWGDEMITKKELTKRLDKGCAWCGEVHHADDFQALGSNEYVCGGCKHFPEVKEYIKDI